ncbi:hypothetical protein GCM10018775_92810 [Streptomyces umbrinus]|nr:hypothetical protein GCM10018775_92810 [Streptomyces umbrinus]
MTDTKRNSHDHRYELLEGDQEYEGPVPEAPPRSEDPRAMAERRARRAVVKDLMDGVA